MTSENMIENLEMLLEEDTCKNDPDFGEALKMAINCFKGEKGDAVSRQSVLDGLAYICHWNEVLGDFVVEEEVEDMVMSLPPVEEDNHDPMYIREYRERLKKELKKRRRYKRHIHYEDWQEGT